MLRRLGFRLLLSGLGLLLLLLLVLLLLSRGLRRCFLVLGGGLFGLILCLLLSTRWRLTANLKLDNILSNGNGILLVDKELLNGTGLRRVQRYVDLVRLDSGNLLVLLNVVANLCMLLVSLRGSCVAVFLTFRPLLQRTLGNRLSHLGHLNGSDIGYTSISIEIMLRIAKTHHSFVSDRESIDVVLRAVQVV